MKKTVKFNFDDIGMKVSKSKKYSIQKKNIELFAEWMINIFKKEVGELKEGTRYFAPSISWSERNDKQLNELIFPMDYLNISPTVDKKLPDDEIEIDMDKCTEEINNG